MTSRLTATALALIAGPGFAQELSNTIPGSVGKVAPALEAYGRTVLFDQEWSNAALSLRDRALVSYAALMTRNEAATIGAHAAIALDAGVTPAELSEVITHLAFYAGWGNAITAAEATAPIFAERGISPADLPAAQPDLLALNQQAEDAREAMVMGNFGEVSIGVVDHTRDVLFRDLWLRPDLAPRDRSMVTVAALIAAGQPEQMTFHLNRAMDNGLTRSEAGAMLSHLAFYAGWPKVFSALPVAKQVFESRAG